MSVTAMRGKLHMRPAIVEVAIVYWMTRRVEVVDLLDPRKQPFVIVDWVIARSAVRFGVYAIHAVPLPNFTRLFGTAYVIPGLAQSGRRGRQCLKSSVHLGGGEDEAFRRRWLMEHYSRFEDALVGGQRWPAAEACSRIWTRSLGRRCMNSRPRLLNAWFCWDSCPDVADDDLAEGEGAEGFAQARAWYAREGDFEREHVGGEGAVLGRVLLGQGYWRVEAMGAARLEKAARAIESLMGDRRPVRRRTV